jgi:hypothetical protein
MDKSNSSRNYNKLHYKKMKKSQLNLSQRAPQDNSPDEYVWFRSFYWEFT